MNLPFTEVQFLDGLGAFNATWWPVVILLWVVSAAAVIGWIRGSGQDRFIGIVLVALWAMGAVYHLAYFTRINPAAWLFGSLFVLQSLLFVFAMMRTPLRFDRPQGGSSIIAAAFLFYALAYPLLVWLTGHAWPRMPAFAVPCPTLVLSTGFLLAAWPRVPRWLLVVPLAWAIVGGSAALLLGVTPDYGLLAAGVVMVGLIAWPRTRLASYRGSNVAVK